MKIHFLLEIQYLQSSNRFLNLQDQSKSRKILKRKQWIKRIIFYFCQEQSSKSQLGKLCCLQNLEQEIKNKEIQYLNNNLHLFQYLVIVITLQINILFFLIHYTILTDAEYKSYKQFFIILIYSIKIFSIQSFTLQILLLLLINKFLYQN
ncbi:unnamed protein product [Paramecium sonneborni]|uniref:Transmembrane protein n=1 Tax=Paramecium sonneborni TaxID=65129 RepID=A0A8S1L7U1_9CILI|nr:unnamed protein product [Paramecium sonneborni]